MEEKVLVTGAGGFIGSHLTEELVRAGHDVRAMVHYNCRNSRGWLDSLPKEISDSVEVISSDIRDPFAVRNSVVGCKTVYHLAALIAIPYSYIAPASYVETNVMGTLNILQACLDEKVDRVIHTSTSEVYGTAQYTPIDEKHPLCGQSPYSASKIAADKLAESYHLSFGLPVSTIRPFNTFGPRQSARAVIPTIISQLLSGMSEISLGSLTPIRDFNYVKDTVSGMLSIANTEKTIGKVTNVGRGEGISIGDLVKLLLEICGSNVTVLCDSKRIRPEKSEVMELVCDNSKALKRLGWKPQYSMLQGLKETVNWIKENNKHYRANEYNC